MAASLRKQTFIVLCSFSVMIILTLSVVNKKPGPETTYRGDLSVDRMQNCISQIKVNWTKSEIVPVIYFITPTYRRPEQVPELIRLGQTLRQVDNLHWIVADDTWQCFENVQKLLKSLNISYTYLASPMPKRYRKHQLIPRGVANRRAGLDWVRKNVPLNSRGVIYLGDDDNVVSLKLFQEIRYTKMVSMFPVGLIGEFSVSSPIVRKGKVTGFYDSWKAGRKFPVDMAGFAISLKLLQNCPNATMPYVPGHEEDRFLQSLDITYDMIEPKADNCTKVYVWHTKTLKNPFRKIKRHHSHRGTNIERLLDDLSYMGVLEKG